MRNTNQMTDEQWDEVSFSEAQLKAIKAVDSAMRKAHKLNVHFWDNYGTLTAFNNAKITAPDVTGDGEYGYESVEPYSCISDVYSKNFYAGNADDPLSFDIR